MGAGAQKKLLETWWIWLIQGFKFFDFSRYLSWALTRPIEKLIVYWSKYSKSSIFILFLGMMGFDWVILDAYTKPSYTIHAVCIEKLVVY